MTGFDQSGPRSLHKLVQTGLDQFFAVFFGLGLVFWLFPFIVDRSGSSPPPKWQKTGTGPDFKALDDGGIVFMDFEIYNW